MNLTITTDEETLRRARIRALEQGTSVNAVVREFLEAYAGVRAEQTEAMRRVLAVAERSRSARRGRSWTRDELHERR